jgi:hypothetical protein
LNGSKDLTPIVFSLRKGKTIVLDASGSFDFDNDELSFEWLVYPEIENLSEIGSMKIEGKKATIQLKDEEVAKSLAIVLRVTDNGYPTLTGYKRIVIDLGL